MGWFSGTTSTRKSGVTLYKNPGAARRLARYERDMKDPRKAAKARAQSRRDYDKVVRQAKAEGWWS